MRKECVHSSYSSLRILSFLLNKLQHTCFNSPEHEQGIFWSISYSARENARSQKLCQFFCVIGGVSESNCTLWTKPRWSQAVSCNLSFVRAENDCTLTNRSSLIRFSIWNVLWALFLAGDNGLIFDPNRIWSRLNFQESNFPRERSNFNKYYQKTRILCRLMSDWICQRFYGTGRKAIGHDVKVCDPMSSRCTMKTFGERSSSNGRNVEKDTAGLGIGQVKTLFLYCLQSCCWAIDTTKGLAFRWCPVYKDWQTLIVEGLRWPLNLDVYVQQDTRHVCRPNRCHVCLLGTTLVWLLIDLHL